MKIYRRMGYLNGATGATQTHEEGTSIRGKLDLLALLVQLAQLVLLALKVKKVKGVILDHKALKVKKVMLEKKD